ncbi:hypothetical protein Poli38472_014802 [Pythium oligandrum]|uniref:NAD(P)-binding domain-containing protein n=1 Tax=Pythium oligandrum TaxID=41045 RepID=A0A8K1CI88_PYTOL|nr:hypothetical protein Poli38472_014802 [Pythium oligandrum]|eukprot:TMW63892.1 hypothetical protein Poli38472_014802 [Pythium oligandrum]
MSSPSAYTAAVAGSTGAVGRNLVAELVSSTKCAKVIALTRREIPEDQWPASFPQLDLETAKSKLEVCKVDFEQITADDLKRSEKIDAAFWCLGTTRKESVTPEGFRKVDLEYATRFGKASKGANATYFGILTTMGAHPDSWFLYGQTKGEAEENIKKLGFERTGIFRPGFIDRAEMSRPIEKVLHWILPSISTRSIARSMLKDFEDGTSSVTEWSNGDMKKTQ